MSQNSKDLDEINLSSDIETSASKNNISSKSSQPSSESNAKWINNDGVEVKEVFGFNQNAELINGRAAMVGFLMLLITELVFKGEPVTKSIFGIY